MPPANSEQRYCCSCGRMVEDWQRGVTFGLDPGLRCCAYCFANAALPVLGGLDPRTANAISGARTRAKERAQEAA